VEPVTQLRLIAVFMALIGLYFGWILLRHLLECYHFIPAI